MGPQPAVAAVRSAVRRTLVDLDSVGTIVVACSGGADSLALLAATVFEARRSGPAVVCVTVDHGLQPGSDQQAHAVAAQARTLGATAARVERVDVGARGGPEGAARSARYAALAHAARDVGAAAVLLGHTRDDQAETVLLGLARGSGARSLSGMAPANGIYRRPLLGVSRADTVAACRAEGLEFWTDPHNADATFARARVRHGVLPALEKHLGPGVAEALARSARLLRDDADALDALAARGFEMAREQTTSGVAVRVTALHAEPDAVRRRILRLAALEAGCPGTDLFLVHVEALDALVTHWHGQGPVHLPGLVRAQRVGGVIGLERPPVAG